MKSVQEIPGEMHVVGSPLRVYGMALFGTIAISMTASAQTRKLPKTDADHIQNAISAGPPAISHDATIIAMDGDKMRTVRQGKNEFTCVSNVSELAQQ